MKANKNSNFLDIYSGSPWEAKHITGLLNLANLNALVEEKNGKFDMQVIVPLNEYANALKIVNKYKGI